MEVKYVNGTASGVQCDIQDGNSLPGKGGALLTEVTICHNTESPLKL